MKLISYSSEYLALVSCNNLSSDPQSIISILHKRVPSKSQPPGDSNYIVHTTLLVFRNIDDTRLSYSHIDVLQPAAIRQAILVAAIVSKRKHV